MILHDVAMGHGPITFRLAFVVGVGPVICVKEQPIKDIYPDAIEVWAFNVTTYGGTSGVFFPDDKMGALMERSKLVEAMRAAEEIYNWKET